MAASHTEVLRKLRIAFTAQELELLQRDPEFERALRECDGSLAGTRKVIEIGGALLAERNRAHSRLQSWNRRK